MFNNVQKQFFEEKYVAFTINQYMFAIKMLDVKEIVNLNAGDSNIVEMPSNSGVKYAISYRKEIINLKNISNIIKKPKTDSKLMILNCQNGQEGLVIDEIEDIITINNESEIVQSILRIKNNKLATIIDCNDLK